MEIQRELIYFIFYFSSIIIFICHFCIHFPFFSKSNNLRVTMKEFITSHSSSLEWHSLEYWADANNYLLVKTGKLHFPWKLLELV